MRLDLARKELEPPLENEDEGLRLTLELALNMPVDPPLIECSLAAVESISRSSSFIAFLIADSTLLHLQSGGP